MTTVRDALRNATDRLLAAEASDAKLDAQYLLAHVLGVARLTLCADPERLVPETDRASYETLITRRASGEPMQYIIGTQDFMGHAFRVNPHVLIPRQDTETLCEAAIQWLKGRAMAVLDIGTGSGALAVSIKLACDDARVTAVDISADALIVATDNAERLGADIRFIQGDLTRPVAGEAFDLIISNPPYLSAEDFTVLQREVRAEPRLALDGGPDGLAVYRRLVPAVSTCLAPGGACMLEVGHTQADAVSAMVADCIGPTRIICDLCGAQRVVMAEKPK